MSVPDEDVLTAISQLLVTSDGDGRLVVDAEALMTQPNQVRYWQLNEITAGEWHHFPSGESGPLGAVLWGLTLVYLDQPVEAS